jgi:hypothetical protein
MRLLVTAALVIPDTVGWSGTRARKSSTDCLKVSTGHPVMLLILAGNKLKSLQPFTPRELSRALLTAAGAVLTCMGLSQSAPAYVIVTELDIISFYQAFRDFPKKDNHISLTTAFLGVKVNFNLYQWLRFSVPETLERKCC